MTDTKKTKLHIVITAAVMIFIFIQSAMPGDISGAESNIIVQFIAGITGWNEEALSIAVRKAAHFTEFFILGICLNINMRDLMNRRAKTAKTEADSESTAKAPHIKAWYLGAAWLIGTAYAITDEFHQLFVPGRTYSAIDVCIDSAGVLLGVIAELIIRANHKENSKDFSISK